MRTPPIPLEPDPERLAVIHERPEFVASAFVRIGRADALSELSTDQMPQGTEIAGSVLPRLAVGLTPGGSLVALFGYTVQT